MKPMRGAYENLGWPVLSSPTERRPAEFLQLRRDMIEAGRRIADETVGAEPLRAINHGRETIAAILRDKTVDEHNADPWTLVAMSQCWYAASVRSKTLAAAEYTITSPLFAWFGSLSQISFTRALPGIASPERQILFQFRGMWDKSERAAWSQHYAGAMTVARTIRALSDLQFSVFLPVVKLDVLYKIDVLARKPPKKTGAFCLQVKGAQYRPRSYAERISAEPSDDEPPSFTLTRHGVHRLASEQRVRLVPGMIYVGHEENQIPWKFDSEHSNLHAALTAFLL